VTIKPSTLDDRVSRRLLSATKGINTNASNGGSVPNILEHPDMKTPVVMGIQQISSPSSSGSSSSSRSGNNNRKLVRQQSGKKPIKTNYLKFLFFIFS
jgi:hypothetical protein